MANIAIFRINYKSDFILTLNSDAGWMTPFCIKFWTGAPSQAYFVGYDGETYTHCAPVAGDPTKLEVQFDDHHLPIGDLKFQIGYHFTVADFPTTVEDEVINQSAVIIDQDGTPMQVMLDLNGETAPEIQFSLPAYANEAQRIANEEQRIAAEAIRIVNEESRIAAETIRQQNEAQRIAQETARVNEFATLKSQSQAATSAANDAATLANQKAQLAADKAALAGAAATLANAKAQLAADKAALANAAAQLANEKAALAQQKAEYAQTQGGYAKDQGDYAKDQGDYAKAQGDTALADHQRAEADHTQAGNDHTRAESDHGIAVDDHTQAGNDHTRAESDHGIAVDDHTQAGNDHTRAESDHTQAGNDHTRAESDHTRAESDHAAVEVYVDSLGVFDLSKHNAVGGVLATYADISAALTALNALDSKYKYGGMSFKFVQTSDNKYVQFRYMPDDATTVATFTNVANWQGVDSKPVMGSLNLVESSGVEEYTSKSLSFIGYKETDSYNIPKGGAVKIANYPFVKGQIYFINLTLTNIVPDSSSIIFVLRASTDTSKAIRTNITQSTQLQYTPSQNHNALYVSCYSGTCTAKVAINRIENKKKVSIIGDSISTFAGFIIDGYRTAYPQQDVLDASLTWWKKYFENDKTLEVNASFSGSGSSNQVVAEWETPTFYGRSSILGSPDEIIVELGTNDTADLGELDYDAAISSLSESLFAPSFLKGIKSLMANYPLSTIKCLIAKTVNDDYAAIIIDICNHYSLDYIDLRNVNYATSDGVHPISAGMETIASCMIAKKKDWSPTQGSCKDVRSGGVHAFVKQEIENYDEELGIEQQESQSALEFSDKNGNSVVVFKNGDLKTKNFDSTKLPNVMEVLSDADLEIVDSAKEAVVRFSEGHIRTRNFNSKNVVYKEVGKGLSSNDLTDALLAQINATITYQGKPAVITIAASNASSYAKENASLVCSGTNDENVINSAIAMLPAHGGEIHLSAGVFYLSAPIVVDRNIKIIGEGQTIAGRPAYTPRAGFDYNNNIYGIYTQNLYGNQLDGGTTIRIEADVNGIELGEVVAQKIKVVLRDFFIQGYGKDRHNHCGIYARYSTDISVIDNVSVTECHIGCYLHGNASNTYQDAIKIINSSFQWCGCGLVVFGAFTTIINCCVADNNGIGSFTDGEGNTTTLNTGGLYMQGSWGTCSNCIFQRNTSFVISESYAGDSVVISTSNFKFTNNYVINSAGNGIRIGTNVSFGKIMNNVILNFGIVDYEGQKNGIKNDGYAAFITISGNDIGGEYESNGGSKMDKAIVMSNGDVFVKDNLFRYFGSTKTTTSSLITASRLIAKDNIYMGYEGTTRYVGEVTDN